MNNEIMPHLFLGKFITVNSYVNKVSSIYLTSIKQHTFYNACRKCHRLIHYECIQLPLYQLQIFVNTYGEQYLCRNCVRITKTLRSKIGKNSYHMMQKEIEKKDDIIKKLKNELAKNCTLKKRYRKHLYEKDG